MVIVEIITASGIMGLAALIFRQIFKRIETMENRHNKALYQENGQPFYMTEEKCGSAQQEICTKIDDIKALIIEMDKKREGAKDEMANIQLKIERRLTKIETQIKANGRGSHD